MKGNVYARAVGPTIQPGPAGGGGLSQAIYYAANVKAAPAGSNTITVNFNTAVNFADVRILEYSGLDPTRPGIVHRLDKDTSGVLVIAKDVSTLADLAAPG